MFKDFFGDWSTIIDEEILNKTLSKVKLGYERNIITPSKKDIFKAFKCCPYKQLKVVILGQDPYNQPNIATGLAFANKEGTKFLSPSLEVIQEALINPHKPYSGEYLNPSLENWANQGVLLLNSALTVTLHKPNSNIDLWRPFICNFLEELGKKNSGLVYILFGTIAETFTPYINHKENYVLLEGHPAYYARCHREMPDRVFKEANRYLLSHYNYKINWVETNV